MLFSSQRRIQFIVSVCRRIGMTAKSLLHTRVKKAPTFRLFHALAKPLLWSCFVLPSHSPSFHCWSETAILPLTRVPCPAATCGFLIRGWGWQVKVWELRTHLRRVHGHRPHLPKQRQSRASRDRCHLTLETRSLGSVTAQYSLRGK